MKKFKGVTFKIDIEKAYGSANYSFFGGGFGEKRLWLTSNMMDNEYCSESKAVCYYGENESYFKTHRGLSQGDPLSPVLFNRVGDALAHILNKAKLIGHIIRHVDSGF
jgi:hypothetical protein